MASKHMKNEKIKEKKHNKKNRNVFKIVILVIFIILLILAGLFYWKVNDNGGGMKGVLTTVVGSDNKKPLDEIQFLLMGESLNLTDTIMICSYNPNTQQANMVSVQRDTYVGSNINNPSASDKINAKYAGKYPEKTLAAVNKITGLNLEYYVIVDTDALTELVDAIGGVDFYVPIDMNYHDTSDDNFLTIELKEGMQKIDGNKAEQLLRFRHNDDGSTYPSSYGEEDLGRMRTQREFITETLKQTLKPSNILKLGELLDIAYNNVETNLSISVIKDYIPYAVEFDTTNISTSALPGTSIRPDPTGPYIYKLDENKTQSLISELFFGGATEETINPEMPNLQILNGSGDATKLEEVVNIYKEQGYNIIKVGNTTSTKKSKIVNRTKQTEEVENKIKELINVTTVNTAKKSDNIDFTITIGKDYSSNN